MDKAVKILSSQLQKKYHVIMLEGAGKKLWGVGRGIFKFRDRLSIEIAKTKFLYGRSFLATPFYYVILSKLILNTRCLKVAFIICLHIQYTVTHYIKTANIHEANMNNKSD